MIRIMRWGKNSNLGGVKIVWEASNARLAFFVGSDRVMTVSATWNNVGKFTSFDNV